MSDAYEVRQARIDDWPLIGRFVTRCYGHGAPYKQEARWRWQFLDAPDADGSVPVWIALSGGEVAGQIALHPARYWIDGVSHPAGWIVDVIAPEHRRSRLRSLRSNGISTRPITTGTRSSRSKRPTRMA